MHETLIKPESHDRTAAYSAPPRSDATTPQDTSDHQSFARVAESGRIIREYSGFLPATRLKARHILRCEHLRQLPGEGFPPYRVEPQFTHQLWLWSRNTPTGNREPQPLAPEPLALVFRGQFEFALPGKDPDALATAVTDFLAFLLLQATDMQQVMRYPDSDLFWADAVASCLEDCNVEMS
jgi:hypothetical protein